ncbi:hypothetical protein HPULCUR_001564 [Helicostylum pulchrum]|uniref:Uncharacterized protein n=1 Tax=Helicostylum pulchrum TaxID=562976 RepID=A0ABP9XPA0_9FUNG
MCIIQSIWTHHWTNIFHDVPFHHNTIIAIATKLLNQLLFEDTEHIEIIGNVMLNDVLENLADLLMPLIVTTNKFVRSNVDTIFEFYD